MQKKMAARKTKLFQLFLLAGSCIIYTVMFLPDMLQAAPELSARYIKASGSQLVIEISIGSPPPASAILIQRFPPGVRMLDSQPGASNYNAARNRAKWLLRNLHPGTSRVSMTLDRPVDQNDISAEVRYKPQQGGRMTTLNVSK